MKMGNAMMTVRDEAICEPRKIAPETLRYSSVFIRHGDQMLMMRRAYEPNAGRINVVGGKLEPGETPTECALREVLEETGIRLADVRFTGIVTWNEDTISFRKHRALGMYIFVAEYPDDLDPTKAEIDTPEGPLVWRPVREILSGADCYADNVRFFLAPMMAGEEPAEYYCEYREGRLQGVTRYPLNQSLCRLAEARSNTR